MFKFDNNEKKIFLERGFVIDKTICKLSSFELLSKKFKIELKEYLMKNNISNLGGFNAGNLNINPGIYGKEIFKIIRDHNFDEYFKFLTDEEIGDFEVSFGGNLNLPKSKKQFYHTDGNWSPRMIILNIATSQINSLNGPLELVESSHKKKETYLSFLINSFFKKKTKILLNEGEILIREHKLWHRGTTNFTNNFREMIGIMFIKKSDKKKMNYKEDNGIVIFSNMFGITLREKIKEFIFVYLKFVFFFYKIFLSIKS